MALARREFLRMATWACAYCIAAGRPSASQPNRPGGADGRPHWSYTGASGPEHWGELQPDFKACQLGLEQTPIDLTNGIKGETGKVVLDYRPLALRAVNNGHTIQVNVDPGCTCTIGNTKYDLLQFHFHHPSEHLLAGKSFDLECHFVHKATDGALAVVGAFIKPGARNADLAAVFDVMPAMEGMEVALSAACNPAALLPKEGGYFRYMGSLTTPPCLEGLTWTVYKEPVEASSEQIGQFASLFANNARPVQRQNQRLLIEAN
jgi:carbonic anhydrase